MAINFYFIYGVFLILILFACAFVSKNTKTNNKILLLSIMLIFIFMAFRKDFTPDYGDEGYKGLFESIHNHGLNDELHSEIGYQELNYILPTYRMVIVVTSLLFCSALFFLFKRYIPYNYWAFAFFVLFLSKDMLLGNISGMRNSIAVSAFIFSFYFLEKNKKIFFLTTLVLASFFHTSSLFFIPLIFINSERLTSKNIQVLWILIIVFALLTTFFPNLIQLFTLWLFTNVSFFSDYEYYLEEEISTGFRGLSFLLIFYIFYMNINVLKIKNLRPKEILLIKLSLLFYILMLLPGFGLSSRMYYFLSFSQLAGNIYVMRRIKRKELRWAYIIGMIVIPLMDFYNLTTSSLFKTFYLNYHSILFS